MTCSILSLRDITMRNHSFNLQIKTLVHNLHIFCETIHCDSSYNSIIEHFLQLSPCTQKVSDKKHWLKVVSLTSFLKGLITSLRSNEVGKGVSSYWKWLSVSISDFLTIASTKHRNGVHRSICMPSLSTDTVECKLCKFVISAFHLKVHYLKNFRLTPFWIVTLMDSASSHVTVWFSSTSLKSRHVRFAVTANALWFRNHCKILLSPLYHI